VFSVKLVARPDARMVEVPLEIDAELPREFEGAVLLAASGLPRRVKIKASKDALKISTAYRADQLLADIVKSTLRGTAQDVQKVQEAVTKFIRTVRERRQNGATLLISSNGRGKIDVLEQLPQSRAAPAETARAAPAPETMAALERRVSELESALARISAGGESGERLSHVEERLTSMQAQLSRVTSGTDVAGPGLERSAAPAVQRTPGPFRRTTAVEAYAEGLRNELRARASASASEARKDTDRCDKAAALAAEAEQVLGAPREGTSERLREASALAAARQTALEHLVEEIEFYSPADLPVAAQLLARLEGGPIAPDPAPSLEPVAQAVVGAARGGDCKPRTAWLRRAAALCHWSLVEPQRGDELQEEWHSPIDSGGKKVVRLASPGVRRADGSVLVRARVHVDQAAKDLPEEPDESQPLPEPLTPRPASLEVPPSAPPPAEIVAPISLPPASPPVFGAPFGDLGGEEAIRPEEAAAAAASASRMPKIVSGDPASFDEALAAEVALAVEAEMTMVETEMTMEEISHDDPEKPADAEAPDKKD
jgi:hypothetical protein